MKRSALFVAATVAALLVAATPAHAGSDSPTPYTVTADGITLPAGTTFADGAHVNIRTNQGDHGIHLETLNNQPSGQWIGAGFLPWTAFGLDPATICVTWAQLSQYDPHFGEGGQAPVGNGCTTTTPTPTPEPSAPIEPTPEPSPAQEPEPEPETPPTITPAPSTPTAPGVPVEPFIPAAPYADSTVTTPAIPDALPATG